MPCASARPIPDLPTRRVVMVAALSPHSSKTPNPSPPPQPQPQPHHGNAAPPRRPRTKDVSSRYLSPSATHSTTSTSTSSSSSTSTTTTTSSSNSSTSRRFPSPFSTPRPTHALPSRSHSVGRTRPDPNNNLTANAEIPISTSSSSAARALCSTTRSFSVSFQGESFFYHTSKAKPSPPPRRDHLDNATPRPSDLRRWPAASRSNPLLRSLDCSPDNRLLQRSIILDRRPSFEAELSASSDSDSVSSGSNSGVPEQRPRLSNGAPRVMPQKIAAPTRSFLSPVRASSPGRVGASPAKARSGGSGGEVSVIGRPGLAPSILSFAAEIRRAKKGENRIEEAHLLRLLHNRHLQWRFVNTKAAAVLALQRSTAERNLYNTWVATSELYSSVAIKRIKLQLLRQNLKLTSILKGQMVYLEDWLHVEKDHSSSLAGAIEALKASIVRLPVVSGRRADVQDLKEAVGSAVDVMQAMASSICSLLPKAEGTSSMLVELARVVAQEEDLLNQAKVLLSSVFALNVRHSSLQGHLLQVMHHNTVKPS